MRVAKQTAQRAVEEAKGARDLSSEQIRASETEEKRIAKQLSDEQRLREKQKAKIKADAAGVRSPEDILAQSEKRSGEAEKRLSRQETELRSKVSANEKVADRYRQFETEIGVAGPKQVVGQTRKFIQSLRDNKLIDDHSYGIALKEIDRAERLFTDSIQLRKRLIYIGVATAGVVGAGEAAKHIGTVVGFP